MSTELITPRFPLEARPSESYKTRPRAFGCSRDGGRKHAGCDLYSTADASVLAVADGTVVRGPYLFYDVVNAIEIAHPGIGIVRYGEISGCPEEIKPGTAVARGQVVAHVGKMRLVPQPMLHFELYSGAADGALTDRTNAPYSRREDLIDPTAFLDSCTVE